jgi:hypothetical protein
MVTSDIISKFPHVYGYMQDTKKENISYSDATENPALSPKNQNQNQNQEVSPTPVTV